MNKCYKLKKIHAGKKNVMFNLFDESFIITLENSINRHKSIDAQLNLQFPTKNVNIVYNKGYSKCDKFYKGKKINKSYLDLTFTNIEIFKYAIKKNLDYILVLEDDFIWSNNIKNSDLLLINNFLKKEKPDMYILGCKPFIINPLTIFHNHMHVIMKGDAHAIIYSQNAMINLLDMYYNNEKLKKDIDLLTNYIPRKYTYKNPLCFQIREPTENSKTWMDDLSTIEKISVYCGIKIENLFNFKNKESIENDYKLFYKAVILFNIFIIILIIYLFYQIRLKSKFNNYKIA